MREVKREGPTVQNLGRHRTVEQGSSIHVTEEEYATIRHDSNWKLIEGDNSDLVPEAVPCFTEHFDLTKVDWRAQGLHTRLRKMGWANIQKIAKAMLSIGICVPTGYPDTNNQILDGVLEKADRHGWTG